MMIHLPSSFSCSECDKKFVHASNLKTHKKCHQGILTEICKLCNKGYATKGGFNEHIIRLHFAKFHCEMTECSSIISSKSDYKIHLKKVHKKDDQVAVKNFIIKLEKLKANFQLLKYVQK